MAAPRSSRSSLIAIVLAVLAAVACLHATLVFVNGSFGATSLRSPALRTTASQRAALPEAAALEATSVVVADVEWGIPIICFVISGFMGVVGYSMWTAFGPGAKDLRDPFEEHED
eukprot:TRINITY_DN2314_c0_g1_i1.p2 TRINITY_DN2314_c0_g1~~TRINITY_DN2314_c0_g1_i1.p2  ORF type:complete len:131 (-),score=29.06 TRINITY_DN2314_c0_g1_i1:375-719(-)